ncbi:MAG TPA: Gfo/Idh/MocA family oxidoreductase [Spirochaetia bacterium]|nr:Gfo/Idh/MocA family oxidoreductase [Spirochaetia bacterium]HRZ63780.1 Gfo/Idh/MocA family oxidoreductase [Spirochaetia bacterium]
MSIKIGIVGAGGMARYHVPGFRAAGAEVVALADPVPEARAKAAAAYGVAETYAGLPEMLAARPELDAVSILTPNKFHLPLALAALGAGKHVFCEKPPALNAADAAAMAAAAKAAGRRLQFNFNNRARPESVAMMGYIRSGEVGRINSAQAVWCRRYGVPGFGGWFTDKSVSGGGPVIDLLHMLDLVLYFMGYPEPEWVLAQTFSDFIDNHDFRGPWGIPDVPGGKIDVEAACHGFVRFKTGQVVMVRSSWAEMTEREIVQASFQGTKAGGLVQRLFARDGIDATSTDRCELYTVEHGRHVDRRIQVPQDESMGRLASAGNFVRVLEGKEEPLNTPDQAVKLMRIVDALYASSAQGRPVQLA